MSKRNVQSLSFSFFAFVVFGFLFFQFSRFSLMQPTLLTDLAGEWSYALQRPGGDLSALDWRILHIPGDLPLREKKFFRNWVTYKKEFDLDPACFSKQCSLAMSEFGDGVKVWLNGTLVGVRGKFDEDGRYEHHYAINVELPPGELHSDRNVLLLESFSPKFELTGPRRPPVGIAFSSEVRAYERAKAFRTVFLNVGSATVLALLGLMILGASLVGQVGSPHRNLYVRCCIASSLFLLSFSEIPREYLSLGFAISLHCVLRYAMDWSNFTFACKALKAPQWLSMPGHMIFFLIEAIFLSLVIAETTSWGWLGGQTVVWRAYSLIRFTGWSNCFAAALVLCLTGQDVFKRNVNKCAFGFALVVLSLQVFDMLLFLGVTHGDYTSKYYLPLVAIAVFGMLVRESVNKHILLRREADRQVAVNQVAGQMAHDICSPIAAMETVIAHASALPEDQRVMIRSAVNRTKEIVGDFRMRSRSADAINDVEAQPDLLSLLIENIVIEKRHDAKSKNVHIEFCVNEDNFGLFSNVFSSGLKRAISNIVNNACESMEKGRITVTLTKVEDDALIRIADSGKGIPSELLAKVLQRGVSHGKQQGTGLGLAQAQEFVQSVSGDLSISSKEGVGTTVSLTLPLCPTPSWFTGTLQFHEETAVVVLDDDVSIHNVWNAKFEKFDRKVAIKSTHNAGEFMHVVEQSSENTIFLVDYELVGETDNGLDLIAKMRIASRSVLVTSRHDECAIRARCTKLGIKIIPKSLVAYVNIVCVLVPKYGQVKTILIDDDTLIHKVWTLELGDELLCFASMDNFLLKEREIDRSCRIYVDQNLGASQCGTDLVPILRELGFEEIYLATGYDSELMGAIPNVKSIVGKNPPTALRPKLNVA